MAKENAALNRARKQKNDEFYTQKKDIENELIHYHHYLKDKIVYCNCDDYRKSKFVEYFMENFEKIGLKKLISTGFSKDGQGTYSEYDGNTLKTGFLSGNGDALGEECTEILKQADVVVTNCPFSLFKEYFRHLIKHKKDFIILGPKNALGYKDIFPYILDNTLKFGTFVNKMLYFYDDERDGKGSLVLWYSTFAIDYEYPVLQATARYDENVHRRYDGYDIIEVKPMKGLPYDYNGLMAIPISGLKYRHNDGKIYATDVDGHKIGYNIVGVILSNYIAVIDGKWIKKKGCFTLDGKNLFKRFIIRRDDSISDIV